MPITYKNNTILNVYNLTTHFYTRKGVVAAVNDLSFHVNKGQVLAIVGESGSGKSVAMMSLLGLIPQPPGRIVKGSAYFDYYDLLQQNNKHKRNIRGNMISMIFQDPMTSLNPYLKISLQLIEGLKAHSPRTTTKQARNKAISLLEEVGLSHAAECIDYYPHQFSGGMRQRIMIAMSLMNDPKLLIADEPTTALDVTIQAQIITLLKKFKTERNLSIILITHDLGLVADIADHVLVMYAGNKVEYGSSEEIFYHSCHPYTHGLLKATPCLDTADTKLQAIAGQPPNLYQTPTGCAFFPRCHKALPVCQSEQKIKEFTPSKTHKISCYRGDESYVQ